MKINWKVAESFKSKQLNKALAEDYLIPRKIRYLLAEKRGSIRVNGAAVAENFRLSAGDEISILADENWFPKLPVPLGKASLTDIVYEDEQIVIVNKACGMKTHGNVAGELALQNHVSAAVGAPVFVVHRLDEETSGLVLFAKNQFVLPILSVMLERREIHRTYEALVAGKFAQPEFVIEAPIGRDRHDGSRRRVSATGQPATTEVSVLAELRKASLVECRLETGRTHQIRVHLSHLGHPIVGDKLYGGKSAPRLMLHAKRIQLKQPLIWELINLSVTSKSFDDSYQKEANNKD